jgi:protein SCO1/2
MFGMFRQISLMIIFAGMLLCAVVSCRDRAPQAVPAASAPATATNQQFFQVKGVVKELKTDERTVVIKHEEVTNYMPAMTMPFEVKNTNELRGLQAGDVVGFRLIVTDQDAWIDHLTKLNTPSPVEQPSRPTVRLARDVDPLNVGDSLPEYHFTNELGEAVSTSQFKGQALAFTFFFTRCPYPTFCPLMSRNFEEAQKKLLTGPNAPIKWHLLSISFDPEFDSPAVLKTYASRYDYDPAHWSFVSGALIDLTAIAEQVGAFFGHDETGAVQHNLRTVVVDASGRVQKIFPNNKWTSDELVAEIIKAAAVRQ